MNEQQQDKSKKDSASLAYILVAIVAIFVFSSSVSILWKVALAMNLLFSIFVGSLARDRKIGVVSAFFISLILSPLVGLLVTLTSPRFKEEEYKEKMLELAETKSGLDVADQLFKLNELRKDGALTDEEFNAQKEKLLNK